MPKEIKIMAKLSMRDKMRDKLKKRTEESHGRGGGGSNFKDFFDSSKMDGIIKWWAGKGEHIIDIIPYLAGKNDPFNKEGEPAYVLDILVHQKVGAGEEQVVCPAENYQQPCPICEDMRRKRNEGADFKTVLKPLQPKRRTVYNIIVRDGGAMEAKGNQVFEISHFFMEKHLAKISKSARTGGYIVFSDPEEGRSIAFERTGTGSDNTGYSGHKFEDRPEPITDAELEAAVCLDDLIKIHTYDEIYKMYYGVGAPSSKDSKSTVDVSNGEDEDEDEGEDEGDSICPDCEEDPCVCEVDPEIKEEVKTPAPRRSAKDKAEAKKAKESNGNKNACPAGGTMGADIDEFDACDDCPKYDKCANLAG